MESLFFWVALADNQALMTCTMYRPQRQSPTPLEFLTDHLDELMTRHHCNHVLVVRRCGRDKRGGHLAYGTVLIDLPCDRTSAKQTGSLVSMGEQRSKPGHSPCSMLSKKSRSHTAPTPRSSLTSSGLVTAVASPSRGSTLHGSYTRGTGHAETKICKERPADACRTQIYWPSGSGKTTKNESKEDHGWEAKLGGF